MGRLISPGDNKLTVTKPGHIRFVLIATRPGIDRELIATNLTIGTVPLAANAVAGGVVAILRGVVLPGDDEAAVIHGRHCRIGLFTGRVGVDPELTTGRRAVGVITLAVDAVVAAACILVA